MGRTTHSLSRPGFVLDQNSVTRESGRVVDWGYVTDTYMDDADVVTMAAAAAAGATSLTVEALPGALAVGTMLNFGTLAPVTVTVNDASISAGETSITIVALPGPIPSGTRLNFTGGTNAQVAEVNGDHAAAVTTLTVLPLDGTIANSSTALFPGGTLMARVTAPAAAGATSITVDELQFAIADDLTATVSGSGQPRTIKAGTVVCALSSGKIVPREIRPASETSIGLLEADAVYQDKSAALSGHGVIVGGVIYENLLPEASGSPATISSTFKTELQTAGVGTGFAFRQYADDRAS